MIDYQALLLTPEDLYQCIRLAFEHKDDPLLDEANRGGVGPFAKYRNEIEFEEYLRLYKKFEEEIALAEQTRKAKKRFTGNGKAGKDEVLAAANMRFRSLNVKSEDQADAIAIGFSAALKLQQQARVAQ